MTRHILFLFVIVMVAAEDNGIPKPTMNSKTFYFEIYFNLIFFSSEISLWFDPTGDVYQISDVVDDSVKNYTNIWMTNLSEKSLQAFELRNNISLVHIVVLVERGDFLDTILALNPDMTKHLDYEALAVFNITPIALAVMLGNIEIVNQLIRGGAGLDGISYLGLSPLHLSIRKGHWRVAESLLEAGASPHYHEEVYRAKLFVEGASSYVNNPSEDAEDVLLFLLKNGADISDLSVFENTETLLNLLIMNSHKELVKQIILVGTNLTKTGSSEVNLVFFVVTKVDLERTEKLEIVEMLLKSRADPNLPSFSPNFTALSWASFLGDTDLVNLLLLWGAQTLPPLPFYSPLFMAMSN